VTPPDGSASFPARLAPVWAAFFDSGAAALIYELLWIHLLGLVFGVTYLAIATVAAVFMAGMAGGAMLSGRLVDRGHSPLLIFLVAEVVLAAFGLLVPRSIPTLQGIFVAIVTATEVGMGGQTLLQLLLCGGLLGLPSLAMGATLPALSRYVVRREDQLARGLGRLYGLNTLGATLGCGLTGFWAIWTWGVLNASAFAALLNLLVAAPMGWLLWRESRSVPARPAPRAEPAGEPGPRSGRFGSFAWLAVFFASGAISMSVEMLLTRVGAMALVNTHLVVFSFVLCAWLMGLGLGGPLGGWLLGRLPARSLYAWLQLAAAGLIIGVPLLRRLVWLFPWPASAEGIWRIGNLTLFAADAVWLGAASLGCGLAFGALFVPANRLFLRRMRALGTSVGGVVSVITLGGIAGSLFTGFLLMPAISAVDALLVAGAGCLGLGLGVLATGAEASRRRRVGLWVVLGSAWAVVAVLAWWIPDHEFLPRYAPYEQILYYRDGRSTTDAVVINGDTGDAELIPNGEPPGRGSDVGAYIPGLLHPAPRRVALLALGPGGNVRPLLLDPAVEQLVCAELSDNQLEAARHLLTGPALEALSDPRFTYVSNDARNFLLTNREPFDVIFNDTATYSNYLHMASHDFLLLARAHLNSGGIYATKLHHGLLNDQEMASMVHTFLEVFPTASLWARFPTESRQENPFFLLLGLNGDEALGFGEVSAGLERRGAMEHWELDGCALLDRFLASTSGLELLARGGFVVDDLHPVATPDIAWRHTVRYMDWRPLDYAPAESTWQEMLALGDPGEWFPDLRQGAAHGCP
jgi:spermidine synthase